MLPPFASLWPSVLLDSGAQNDFAMRLHLCQAIVSELTVLHLYHSASLTLASGVT